MNNQTEMRMDNEREAVVILMGLRVRVQGVQGTRSRRARSQCSAVPKPLSPKP